MFRRGSRASIIDAKVFSRKGVEKDERTRQIEEHEIGRLLKDQRDELDIIRKTAARQMAQALVGKTSDSSIKDGKKIYLKKGDPFTEEALAEIPSGIWDQISAAKDPAASMEVETIFSNYRQQVQAVKELFEEKINKLKRGDELPPGVIKMVKVYIAVKRKLQVGDKMAGRHGNKGVVSRILPSEDMPYFPDGTPMDIVLNPLGVPSRMNVGQVLETHLGWAAKGLGHLLADMLEEHLRALKERETIEDKLHRIYNDLEYGEFFENASDQEFRELIPRSQRGHTRGHSCFRRGRRGRDQGLSQGSRRVRNGPVLPLRRTYRFAFRSAGYRRRYVHAQTPPPGG